MPLRTCSVALANALAGGVKLWSADIFKIVLADGLTTYYWTSWDSDLTLDGQLYKSKNPWLKRSKWNVVNTMEVPSLTVYLMALNDSFDGGAQIKTQIHNGIFDGASLLLSRVYMDVPGATDALGAIDLFGGLTGAIDLNANQATLTVKGKNNNLDQYVPRNLFQIGCNHAFCDTGCTLSRAAFTDSYTMGGVPTTSHIPWGAAPGTPGKYQFGTITVTSGSTSGQRRTIQSADASGLTLSYPLYAAPEAGDTFTAFQGCNKTFDADNVQSCLARANGQNYRGFEFVPPPNSAY